MAHFINTKNGKKIILRNPAEKGKRFARQLKTGRVTETGETLNNTQKAWRSGYLTARQDNADAYNAKRGVKRKKRFRKKN